VPSRGRLDVRPGQPQRFRWPYPGVAKKANQNGVAVAPQSHRDFLEPADVAPAERLDMAGAELADSEPGS
jgi:hypothetical protein